MTILISDRKANRTPKEVGWPCGGSRVDASATAPSGPEAIGSLAGQNTTGGGERPEDCRMADCQRTVIRTGTTGYVYGVSVPTASAAV